MIHMAAYNQPMSVRLCAILVAALCPQTLFPAPSHLQGEMAGEATTQSVILQSRLTADAIAPDGDVPGHPGWGRFEISTDTTFRNSRFTSWQEAVPESDFLIKSQVEGLDPDTRYHYRLVYGTGKEDARPGPTRTFRTLAGRGTSRGISFVVTTGMNYAFFQNGPKGDGKKAYTGADKAQGFPALASMLARDPDFFVGTGDNIYYDHPVQTRATTIPEMRKKWHEQFVQPRFVELFAKVPTYWEKDDHDHRYNDNDNTGSKLPLSDTGIAIFREQVPIVPPGDDQSPTYRTHRISREVQIWLLEGRDYRSPNRSPDGPDKTIWGKQQKQWLKETLLGSDATFKFIITPTPMVGPDGKGKKDNHTNIGGFRHEGNAFFAWARENGFLEKGLYLICGDRHWQYQSIHPSGFEEYSCGALVDANSRMGVSPGTRNSTDPEGRVKQPYTSREPSGGFLEVKVSPARGDQPALTEFNFLDEHGKLLHEVKRFR